MYERSRNILDCNIAGFIYYNGLNVIKKLELGTPVTLKAEPDNPYDPEAVAVYFEETKLGYIPKARNSYISTLLYFGYGDIIEAAICGRNLEEHTENYFNIVVRLKDNR